MKSIKYCNEEPAFLTRMAQITAMQRIGRVGMNCGCEYTAFPLFCSLRPYSRLQHSVGVAQIVWQHTHDKRQAVAGLLHDIATPAFAHVIDFLHGDYLTQESTEEGTRSIIEQSDDLMAMLALEGLGLDEVCDYHQYPIADNDSPRLSADRLEYTLGNMVNFRFATTEEAQRLYDDITVGTNEEGEPELVFTDPQAAHRFARLSLQCSYIYTSDQDRYAMQILAELIAEAIRRGILDEKDLYTDEPTIIDRLMADSYMRSRWQQFRSMRCLCYPETDTPESRIIDAKRRCIDPLVSGAGRVSALFPGYKVLLEQYRITPYDYRMAVER